MPFNLSSDLRDQLRALARREGVSFYTVLLAALQILLARYQQDAERILVGVPTAGRERQEFAQTFGYFVNLVVVDATLTNVPFTTFLQQVRAKLLGAIKHRAYPFAWVVKDLHIERDLSRGPIFQASLVVQRPQKLSKETLRLLKGEQVQLACDLLLQFSGWLQTTEESDIMFDLMEHTTPEGLVGYIRYRTDLFSESTIKRMGQHYQQLLKAVVSDATQGIFQLPLLTERERLKLLIEWNECAAGSPTVRDTVTDYPKECEASPWDKCIHQLFEEEVERTPEAIAVVFADQQLTYQELNARANQLAHYLMTQGVGPDRLVGLFVERSLEMVIGILAIFKAGAAYLALAPAYPRDRLEFMISDAQVSHLLTQEKLLHSLPSRDDNSVNQVICFEREQDAIISQSHHNLTATCAPNNLAYVIYTSGSTGKPKGVLVEHRSLANAYFAWEDAYSLRTESRCHLQMASFSFDVFIGDLVRALCSGGKLVICPREILLQPEKLYNLMTREQIQCAEFVPAVFRQLAKYLQQSKQTLHFMRILIVASDKWYMNEYKAYQQLCGPQTRLINSYGVSEATIDSTYFETSDHTISNNGVVPIGKPFPNTQIYILDQYLQPQPVGLSGELHIGGPGLARGYKGRPQLTEEAFINNPFGAGKLYKTGDLARYLPDGNIEFMGRTDFQVKIRGFRIELGEIESALRAIAGVREAVVLAREDNAKRGDKRLVAYFVGDAERDTLREQLAQRLPDYMVPSAFVTVEAMPLTPNGKLDRRALPVPDMSALVSKETFVSPRTPTEMALANIWSEVLGLEQVGIHNNFFEIGGDSILSIQIVGRAKQSGIQLTTMDLFQHQTIMALASVAREGTQSHAEQGIVTGQLPLTPIQQWFLEEEWDEPHHFNQAFLIETAPTVNPIWLETALTALLRQHDALRLRFYYMDMDMDQKWQQVNQGMDQKVALEVVDLSMLSSDEREKQLAYVSNCAQSTLDLGEGPLLRAVLFTVGKQEAGRLLLVIHHLAVDGVSWRILLEDLQTAYQQCARGEAINLPAKTTAFRDWAHWLCRSGLRQVTGEREWWQHVVQLSQRDAQVDFPIDFPDRIAENSVESVDNVLCTLSIADTEALLHKAPAAYHTQINDLLLTALAQTIGEWMGTQHVAFDLEGHGRELAEGHDLDLSRTVGWFTSVFPVTLHLDQKETGALIKSIKEQLRTIPNRGIGYGILRYIGQMTELIPAKPIGLIFN